MSKSGDPSPSSPKKTSANKKLLNPRKNSGPAAAKNSKTAPKAALVKKTLPRLPLRLRKRPPPSPLRKKGPGKESVSGFCLQEGGAGRQKDSGKGA